MEVDCLVVGAGFSGATVAERLAAGRGQRVTVVDKRQHVGGNAYDCRDEHGVLVHRYGPHIFHTNSGKVWTYLSQFTDWIPYGHRVLAAIDGKLVPVPFNLASLEMLFPGDKAGRIEEKLIGTYGYGAKVPVLKLRKSVDEDIRELAEYVYEKVFLCYTLKQWGVRPEELSPSVTARVPVHISRDDRYFQDTWQAMPKDGYTRLFDNMLDHPGITLRLGEDFRDIREETGARRIVYTGPIDAYFDYCYGKLPYRSLEFRHEHHAGVGSFQPAATVNYPNDHDYTRVTEFRKLTGEPGQGTSTVAEYPCSDGDPYYPIPREENESVYKKYEALAKEETNVTFVGRLARYRYFNMDQAVAAALVTVEAMED